MIVSLLRWNRRMECRRHGCHTLLILRKLIVCFQWSYYHFSNYWYGQRNIINNFNENWSTIQACESFQRKKWLKCHYNKREQFLNLFICITINSNFSSLKPTPAAAWLCTPRTYCKVQTWLEINLDLDDWDWKRKPRGLKPIFNAIVSATPDLMKLIICKCKVKSGASYGWRIAGIK